MFEIYPNHLEVNALLKTFQKDFQFNTFKEEHKADRYGYVFKTVYAATSQAGQRDLEVTFINTLNTHQNQTQKKHKIAKLVFVDNEVQVFNSDKIRNDARTIIHMLETMLELLFIC